MHTSDLALVAYASWTLALVFAIACLRASLTLTGKRAANGFSVTGDDVSPFSGRLCRAHANCVENLPVFAAVVVAARLSGHAAAVDPIAPWIVAARVAQSSVHLVSTSPRAVTIRFVFFALQLGALAVCIARVVLA